MCLGIPMRVKSMQGDFAKVASGRLLRSVNIQLLPNVKKGDYVIVHAGFAIQVVDAKRAKETLRIISEI